METKEPLNIDEVHAGTLKIVEKLSSICDMWFTGSLFVPFLVFVLGT